MLKRSLLFLLPLFLVALLLVAGWFWLQHYTRHDVTRRVPDLKGSGLDEARVILENRDLEALVIDSIYNHELAPGTVVDQDPPAGRDVKPGRKVYLVLNASQPKMIDMPRLVDLSKRQAISIMEIIGLRVEELQYRPDPCMDCVLDQLYKGEHIAPDTRIRRGESVTLVLGSGERGAKVPVPDLRGLTYAEVRMVMNMASMNMGAVVACEGCNTQEDSSFARVRRQSPSWDPNSRIAMGSMIDVWLTADTTGLRPAEDWDDPTRYMLEAPSDTISDDLDIDP
jgi:eukaryotic-like serine/threonine-protein kinase